MMRLQARLVIAVIMMVCPGSALARTISGFEKDAASVLTKPDDVEAIKQRAPITEANQVEGQLSLWFGWRHETGNGAKRDDALSVSWYRQAAIRGNAAAQFRLGLFYFEGRGVPQDDSRAVGWYRAAAEQGLAKPRPTDCAGCKRSPAVAQYAVNILRTTNPRKPWPRIGSYVDTFT
jgi:TPR repeat protein